MATSDREFTLQLSTPLWLIAIAASADGIQAISTILGALPQDLPAAVVIVQHRVSTRESHLARILAGKTPMPVVTAADQQRIAPGTVYSRPRQRTRGRIVIRDRGRLEGTCCECYRVMRAEQQRLLG